MNAETSQGAGPQYLFFQACGQRFALEVRHVEEVVQPRPMVPAPLVPDFIGGLINLRGRVITVISLRRLLGLGGDEAKAAAFAVLRLPGMSLAFGVEEILGIEHLGAGTLGQVTAAEGGDESPVKAVFHHGGVPVNLLDMEKLVSFIVSFDYKGSGTAGS